MKQHDLLYTSADIHTRIKHIFGQPNRGDKRVALVAYVGTDGEKYLPHPEGLLLICNLSAGGTDPDTLRQLLKRGAIIKVSDRLHMKVYWSQNRGCVIASANASSNALGKNGLKEAGIWLPSRTVNINRFIRYASPRKLREGDLRQLDMESRELSKHFRKRRSAKIRAQDFLRWYSSPHRSSWKISWTYKEVSGNAGTVKAETQAEYGHKEPYTWSSCRKNTVRRNDYLLSFLITKGGTAINAHWLFTDFVVKLSPTEKRYYSRYFPCHAVQVNGPSKCPTPPFQITPQFRKALSAAVKLYTGDRFIDAKSDIPSERFLKMIERQYKRGRLA
jgi:hypothetical protein